MDTKQWLARVTTESANDAIAKAIGMSGSTFDSQLKSVGGLKAETIVRIARAYNYSPIKALVDLGLITAAEARDAFGIKAISIAEALDSATDEQILREIGERLEKRRNMSARPARKVAVPRTEAARKAETERKQKDRPGN